MTLIPRKLYKIRVSRDREMDSFSVAFQVVCLVIFGLFFVLMEGMDRPLTFSARIVQSEALLITTDRGLGGNQCILKPHLGQATA